VSSTQSPRWRPSWQRPKRKFALDRGVSPVGDHRPRRRAPYPGTGVIANKQAAGLLPPAASYPAGCLGAFAQGEGYSDPIEGGRVQTLTIRKPAA